MFMIQSVKVHTHDDLNFSIYEGEPNEVSVMSDTESELDSYCHKTRLPSNRERLHPIELLD